MRLLSIKVTIPDFAGLSEAVRARMEALVENVAKAAEIDVKASMNEPKTGRTYRIGDVVRNLRKGERPGMKVWTRQGQMVMRTATGFRAKENATGTRVNVVIGARLHRASAPGESPAIDTGELVNSIGTRSLGPMRWCVYAATEYAKHLEYGTAKMAPRPFMRPAGDRLRQPFIDAAREAIRP